MNMNKVEQKKKKKKKKKTYFPFQVLSSPCKLVGYSGLEPTD